MKDAGLFIDKLFFNGKTPTPGDYVRAKRKQLNLTLKDLELITGIGEANLSSYENNKKSFSLIVAVKLGAAINLDPEILLIPTIKEEMKSKEIKAIIAKSKKLQKRKT